MVKIEIENKAIDSYWSLINQISENFLRPIDLLRSMDLTGEVKSTGILFNNDEQALLDFTIMKFEEIIKSKPDKLRGYIQNYFSGSKNYTEDFLMEFEECMRYNAFRGSAKARDHFRNLGIKACPYCNAQFTISTGKKGNVLCHFDHIYPKSEYPFLALSIYNLVPCCSYCNQSKSKTNPLNEKFIHPFEDSIANKFKFKASDKAIKDYLTDGDLPKDQKNLVISDLSTSFNMTKFNILELYNEHSDIIQEAYIRALVYNDDYVEEIKNQFSLTQDEIDRVVNGNYMIEADINKRPLSKLQQDLRDQFELLKK